MYLHAAGREDIDVRMLGLGRPFVMEIVNPMRAISGSEKLEKLSISGPHIFCKEFKIVDKSFFDGLKEMETSKAKSYAAVMFSKEPFTQ